MRLTLGASPCPNDCFIIDAIVHRRIDLEGLEFDVRLDDVEALNRAAFAGQLDVTKLSYHAFAFCADRFVALNAGSALGRGCGPLLISKRQIDPEQVAGGGLAIAIPGKYTTANFLLGFAFPAAANRTEMVFSDVEGAVLSGEVDAGVIIHENRFTYEGKGSAKDHRSRRALGTARPGFRSRWAAFVASRALPAEVIARVDRILRRSVEFAFANPAASLPFVREHAQEMSEEVMYQHIRLYVNVYSIELGVDGRRAVTLLLEHVAEQAPIPRTTEPLFVET